MKRKNDIEDTILDSRLISATLEDRKERYYDIKIVECGDYIQVYQYERKRVVSRNDKTDLDLKKIMAKSKKNEICGHKEKEKNIEIYGHKKIEERNIIRSKLECQRLAKANANCWKTFITLTIAENTDNINKCYNELRKFFYKIQRVKKDFKYICIPEFQKRGAIHYHLLTNIDIKDNNLMFTQEDNKKFRHIKYWNEGFDRVDNISGDIKKIIGYISKYMTKDVDNRLFSHRRYYSSKKLIKPISNFVDMSNKKNLDFYAKAIKDKTLIFEKVYENIHDKSMVIFEEYLK